MASLVSSIECYNLLQYLLYEQRMGKAPKRYRTGHVVCFAKSGDRHTQSATLALHHLIDIISLIP